MQERQISIRDLLLEILLRWRMIVIWALIGAVLFGAYSFVKSYRTSVEQADRVEAAKQQLEDERLAALQDIPHSADEMPKWFEENLTETQMRNVNYVMTYEALYNDKLAYQEQSILMQIDPNNVSRAEITFYIDCDDRQQGYDIEKVYEDIACSGEAYEYIAGQVGSETAKVNEAFSLGRSSSGLLNGTDTFKIVILHYDENICQDMAQAMIDFIRNRHGDLEEKLGAHEVEVLNLSLAVVTNTNIMGHQRSYMADIASLEATVVDYKAKFTNIEWQYYDWLLNGQLTELSEENMKDETDAEKSEEEGESLLDIINTGVTVKPGISIKYVILGTVLLAFVYVFYILTKSILNTRLCFTDNLQELYSIPQLASIPNPSHVKKPFAFIDKWIVSLFNRNKRQFTKEEVLKFTEVSVKMAVKKEACTFVSIIGCDLKGQSLEVCEEIKKGFDSDNVKVNILNNVLYDARAMGELEGTQGAILVERAGSTLYNEILQELELLKRQGIKVLGGIVVE